MKYFIDPFGCVKNQVDAENMMAHLNNVGWVSMQNVEDADVIIVNSCGFIESAKQESIDAVMQWRKLFPNKKIILAGCLAMRYEKELKESLIEVDEIIASRRDAETQSGKRPILSLPGSAYVKISDGCNNHCSYCAIPLIRGSLKSRTIPDIVEECKTLLARGIKELCIVGQDIGAYGADKQHSAIKNAPNVVQKPSPQSLVPSHYSLLPDLLTAISKIEQQHFWVRLLYIHPDHFPIKILNIMQKDRRFLPYFDIPFQHASAPILKAMNRRGNAEQYLKLIRTIRAKLPQAVIRSTFLLGFPGETEKDFKALKLFQQKAKLDWLGCFAYSREEGTPAYSMKKQVPKKTANARKQIIEELQIPITQKNMERFAGQERVVLLEEKIDGDENNPAFYLGRLYCHAPEIDGAAVIVGADEADKNLQLGTFVNCKVIARRGLDLEVNICH